MCRAKPHRANHSTHCQSRGRWGTYWIFGTLSPCGVLREIARQRDGFAAILPDGIVDLAIAAQYGEMSSGRCLVVLLKKGMEVSATAPRDEIPESKAGA